MNSKQEAYRQIVWIVSTLRTSGTEWTTSFPGSICTNFDENFLDLVSQRLHSAFYCCNRGRSDWYHHHMIGWRISYPQPQRCHGERNDTLEPSHDRWVDLMQCWGFTTGTIWHSRISPGSTILQKSSPLLPSSDNCYSRHGRHLYTLFSLKAYPFGVELISCPATFALRIWYMLLFLQLLSRMVSQLPKIWKEIIVSLS